MGTNKRAKNNHLIFSKVNNKDTLKKLTAFHLFFHFSQEVGVEWNEATKWIEVAAAAVVAGVVDDNKVDIFNEFLRNNTFCHLGICIIKSKN